MPIYICRLDREMARIAAIDETCMLWNTTRRSQCLLMI